jgi:hypothetical protein
VHNLVYLPPSQRIWSTLLWSGEFDLPDPLSQGQGIWFTLVEFYPLSKITRPSS